MSWRVLKEIGIDAGALKALCAGWQWHRDAIKSKKAPRRNYCLDKERFCLDIAEGYLQAQYEVTKYQVYDKLNSVVQSSAMVECINSIIRPYLNASRNHITQEMLNRRIPIFPVMPLTVKYVSLPLVSIGSIVLIYSMTVCIIILAAFSLYQKVQGPFSRKLTTLRIELSIAPLPIGRFNALTAGKDSRCSLRTKYSRSVLIALLLRPRQIACTACTTLAASPL